VLTRIEDSREGALLDEERSISAHSILTRN
jgi:hypothetical protein